MVSSIKLHFFSSISLAADAFGFQRYLGLIPYSDEIRKNLRFGPQMDHAPIVMFELMDIAYRLERATALLSSSTHPAPLMRANRLMELGSDSLSEEGRTGTSTVQRDLLSSVAKLVSSHAMPTN